MAILDTLFGWILLFHPALSILIISLIISFIITIAIKLFTDQNLMKDLRNELKELQNEMKELRNNPKKMAKVNDRFMETNMKYMSHSMRPTLFTFLPIILIFGWLNAHIGYYPIMPGTLFDVMLSFEPETTGTVQLLEQDGIYLDEGDYKREIESSVGFSLYGEIGEYELNFIVNDVEEPFTKKVIITEEKLYAPVEKSFKKKTFIFTSPNEYGLNSIKLTNKKVIPFEDVPVLKDLPWISGWGWFGVYFLFSIVFSMSLRKIFQIH